MHKKQLKEIDQAIISHKDLSSLKNIEISLKDNNTYISFKENTSISRFRC